MNNHTELKNRFIMGARWNIGGSILYESVKLIHQYLLLQWLPLPTYGVMGTLFSTIYLTIFLASLGAEQALPPFLSAITESKKNFKRLFPFYALPALAALFILGSVMLFIGAKTFLRTAPTMFIVMLFFLIILEGSRIFLRTFLHNLSLHKSTMMIELFVTIFSLSMVWILHFLGGLPLCLSLIFMPYAIGSWCAVILLSCLLARQYRLLPNKPLAVPHNFWQRVMKTRAQNYFIFVAKQLFSGNFLVTLCAFKFGFAEAGIFKFASYLADFLKGIIQVIIGFSGGALLAKLKHGSMIAKKAAFQLISQKIMLVIYSISIFLIMNYRALLPLHNTPHHQLLLLAPSALFLLLTFLDHFSYAYTQFYTLEEKAGSIVLLKAIETILLFFTVTVSSPLPPLTILLNIVMLKLLCFALIATKAYRQWQIMPSFTINFRLLSMSFVASGMIWYLIEMVSVFFRQPISKAFFTTA